MVRPTRVGLKGPCREREMALPADTEPIGAPPRALPRRLWLALISTRATGSGHRDRANRHDRLRHRPRSRGGDRRAGIHALIFGRWAMQDHAVAERLARSHPGPACDTLRQPWPMRGARAAARQTSMDSTSRGIRRAAAIADSSSIHRSEAKRGQPSSRKTRLAVGAARSTIARWCSSGAGRSRGLDAPSCWAFYSQSRSLSARPCSRAPSTAFPIVIGLL